MKLHVEIEMDNQAFVDDAPYECERILETLSDYLGTARDLARLDWPAFDSNGNRVGRAWVTETERARQ